MLFVLVWQQFVLYHSQLLYAGRIINRTAAAKDIWNFVLRKVFSAKDLAIQVM
jgi:hypothetical protein